VEKSGQLNQGKFCSGTLKKGFICCRTPPTHVFAEYHYESLFFLPEDTAAIILIFSIVWEREQAVDGQSCP